jgi:hypothetical protein
MTCHLKKTHDNLFPGQKAREGVAQLFRAHGGCTCVVLVGISLPKLRVESYMVKRPFWFPLPRVWCSCQIQVLCVVCKSKHLLGVSNESSTSQTKPFTNINRVHSTSKPKKQAMAEQLMDVADTCIEVTDVVYAQPVHPGLHNPCWVHFQASRQRTDSELRQVWVDAVSEVRSAL